MFKCDYNCFCCVHPDCICPDDVPLSTADRDLIEQLIDPKKYKQRQKRQEYYALNRVKINNIHRAYRDAHKAEIALRQKRWYQANRERILAKQRERGLAKQETNNEHLS